MRALALAPVICLVAACGTAAAPPAAPPTDSPLDQRIARCAALPGDPREHWDCLALPDREPGAGFLLLLDRIDRDDRAAIASGLRLRPFADGDNAEQLDRALAGVIDRKPAMLVEEARKAGVEPTEIEQIAGMLPEDLVDHTEAQERLRAARYKAIDAALAREGG